MPALSDLYDCVRSLCAELTALRLSPRPADADWRHHQLSLDHAAEQRVKCRAAVDAAIGTLQAVCGELPKAWLGDEPQASKYVRLKRALEQIRYWLHEFCKPFRGYKMPMDCDEQDQHDDPADVTDWEDAEGAVRRLGDELRDYIDLASAKAARAPGRTAPPPPMVGAAGSGGEGRAQGAAVVERIRQLPIQAEFMPVLMRACRHVLERPAEFAAASRAIDADVAAADATWTARGNSSHQAPYWLQHLLADAARTDPPRLGGHRYIEWARKVLLLAVLAAYPGDLSRFGACGAVPWDTDDSGFDAPDAQLPPFRPGRSWVLFDTAGALRADMSDQAGAHKVRQFNVLVGGEVREVVEPKPWRTRGVLGKLVDRLEPILAELDAAADLDPATRAEAPEPTAAAPVATPCPGSGGPATANGYSPPAPSADAKPTREARMPWKEARRKAEDHCARNPFPGVRALARIVRCSFSTMSKAIRNSAALRQKRAEQERRRGSVSAGAMTERVAESATQARESSPVDDAVIAELARKHEQIDADPLLRRLIGDATPQQREVYLAETPLEKLRELAETAYHDPAAGQRVRGAGR